MDGRENRHYVQESVEAEREEQVHRAARPAVRVGVSGMSNMAIEIS